MSAAYTRLDELPAYLMDGVHRFMESACIFALTDVRGTIVLANDAFCEISGYPREELVGRNHRILKSGLHPPEFYRGLWKTIARGDTWHGEICNRAKSGRHYWVDSTISPVLDRDGHIAFYCALRVDITERKAAQAQLLESQARQAESKRLAMLGSMADGVCHDLNNMLGGVLMLADMDPTAEDRREMQKALLLRMAHLIRNLRDYSTGRPVGRRTFNASRMIAETCRVVTFEAVHARQIDLEVDTDAIADCEVHGNEGQILEVLLNLLTNAREALRDTAHPRISVTCSAQPETGMVEIIVADNGPGVPAAIRDSIFEPYVSSNGAGRGLGLSAARHIAREHGGDLTLENSAEGAQFCFTVPMHGRAEPSPVTVAADEIVLVVDDDVDLINSLSESLENCGIHALATAHADEVMVRAEQFKERLAAAVLDSAGLAQEYALVGFLRSVHPELPIVLISAKLDRAGLVGTKYGPVHYLPKPFEIRALLEILRPSGQRR